MSVFVRERGEMYGLAISLGIATVGLGERGGERAMVIAFELDSCEPVNYSSVTF